MTYDFERKAEIIRGLFKQSGIPAHASNTIMRTAPELIGWRTMVEEYLDAATALAPLAEAATASQPLMETSVDWQKIESTPAFSGVHWMRHLLISGLPINEHVFPEAWSRYVRAYKPVFFGEEKRTSVPAGL